MEQFIVQLGQSYLKSAVSLVVATLALLKLQKATTYKLSTLFMQSGLYGMVATKMKKRY